MLWLDRVKRWCGWRTEAGKHNLIRRREKSEQEAWHRKKILIKLFAKLINNFVFGYENGWLYYSAGEWVKTFLLFKSFSFGKRDKNKTPKFPQIHRKWSRNYLRFYIKDDKFHSLGGNKDISFDLMSYLSVSELHSSNDIFSNMQSWIELEQADLFKVVVWLMYPCLAMRGISNAIHQPPNPNPWKI